MLMFRVLRHLLPSGLAWRATIDKALRRYLDGLSASYDDARVYVDDVYDDLFPSRTRWLSRWERQFGLSGRGSTADRIASLEAAWQAQGGQSPRYIHDLLRTAGFDICLHEWWTTDVSPRIPFDPRDVASQPVVGTNHCDAVNGTQPQCIAGSVATLLEPQPQCDAFLGNYTKYLVNKTLRRVAPPPLPSDPLLWPFFWYLSGSPHSREVPAILDGAGRNTLERLALKVGPAHQWIVTNIDWAEPPAFLAEDGAHRWISRGLDEGELTLWASSKGDVVRADPGPTVQARLFERIQGVAFGTTLVGDDSSISEGLFQSFQESSPWTIAACIRPTGGDAEVVQLFGAGLEQIIFRLSDAGQVRARTIDSAGNSSTSQWFIIPFVLDEVVSIVATYDGSGAFEIYANGVSIGSNNVTHRVISSLDTLHIGDDSDIADVALIGREIDATEAAAYAAYCNALYRPKSDVAGGVIERWRAQGLADGDVSLWPGEKGAFDLDSTLGTLPSSEEAIVDNAFRGVNFESGDNLYVTAAGTLKTAIEGSFSFAWAGHTHTDNGNRQVLYCDDTAGTSFIDLAISEAGTITLWRGEDFPSPRFSASGPTGIIPDDGEFHSWVLTYDHSSGRVTVFLDGEVILDVTNADLTTMVINVDRFQAFSRAGSFRYGTVADGMVFDSTLSDDDAASVGKWLMWLYSSCSLPPEEGGMGDFEFLLIG